MSLTAATGAGIEPGTARVEHTYDAMCSAVHTAIARARDVHESSYRIAGRTVTIRLAGRQLGASITRALSHLRLDAVAAAPDLLIEAWDERETGINTPLCAVRDGADDAGKTAASPDGRRVLFEQFCTTSVLDRSAQHIVTWFADAHRLSQYELGRPWHSELLLWQHDRGLQPVHAGFIERDGHGVLLGGPGGSGKSTTSLACMQDGWAYLADDYVGVERTAGRGVVGHSVYSSAHLDPTHLLRFPSLLSRAVPGRLPREDKSLVLLADLPNVRLASRADLVVIAFPRVTEQRESSFRPASKAEALLRLAPSSLLLLPYVGLGHVGFQFLSELVTVLPTFWLDVGRDVSRISTAVDALLADALDA